MCGGFNQISFCCHENGKPSSHVASSSSTTPGGSSQLVTLEQASDPKLIAEHKGFQGWSVLLNEG